MKALMYLFYACCKDDSKTNRLKKELLALEIARDQLLESELPLRIEAYYDYSCDYRIEPLQYFSKSTGKPISASEKLTEIEEEIASFTDTMKKNQSKKL